MNASAISELLSAAGTAMLGLAALIAAIRRKDHNTSAAAANRQTSSAVSQPGVNNRRLFGAFFLGIGAPAIVAALLLFSARELPAEQYALYRFIFNMAVLHFAAVLGADTIRWRWAGGDFHRP